MLALKKIEENDAVDYSFLFSKLEKLSLENARFRKAFTQIENVASDIATGNLSARMSYGDEFDKLTPTYCALNRAYDFTDRLFQKINSLHKTALKEQDVGGCRDRND